MSLLSPPKPGGRLPYPNLSALGAVFKEVYESEYGKYRVPEIAEDDSAEWWFHRGEAFITLGRSALAEDPFMEALTRYRRISGPDLDKAACVESQGNIYRDTGRRDKAEKAYQEALTIYRSFPGTELMQGRCTAELARYYQSVDILSCAREMAEKALKICEPFPPGATKKIRVDCRTLLVELKEE